MHESTTIPTFLAARLAMAILSSVAAVSSHAEPAIQGLSFDAAPLQNGLSTVTVKGSGFGPGPNVVLFEDFSLINATANPSQPLTPLSGSWYKAEGDINLIDKDPSDQLDNALVVRNSVDTPTQISLVFGIEDSAGVHQLRHFQEVFLSYSVKDFGDFPGRDGTTDSFSSISSSKNAWLMFGHRGDNTSYATSLGQPAGHDLVVSTWTGGGFATTGNNTKLSPSFWHPDLTKNWAFQDWNTINFHAALDPKNPYGNAEGFFEFINSNTYSKKERLGNFMSDQTSEGVPYPYWDRVKFFAWDRFEESKVKRVADNLYVAIGDNANARIFLTDNEQLQKSKIMIHLLPLTWSNEEIKAHIPVDARKANYLHIVTANNEISKSRYLCQNCPIPPVLQTE